MKYEIARYLVPEFEKRIAKANRRLERAGTDARFTFTCKNFTDTGVDNLGMDYQVPMTQIMLSDLSLAIGDYIFMARVEWEEAGPVVYTMPGESLQGWRPENMVCAHCGLSRRRTKMYVVRSRTGERIILGSNCLELYTGVRAVAMWALEFDQELGEGWEPDDYTDQRSERKAHQNSVIALAWAISDQGRRYISAGKAQEGGISTSEMVRKALWGPREDLLPAISMAQEYLKDEELLEAIRSAAETVSEKSDYGQNLRVFANSDWLSPRGVGMVTSLASVYARNREELASRPNVSTGFIGQVGDKLRGVKLTLSTVRSWEGQYGITTLLVGMTADGHVVKWFASKELDVQPGQVVQIKSCAIKACEQFKGVDQTVITRARMAA